MSSVAVAKVVFLTSGTELTSIEEEITVGKDVLELVTGAMYADPLSIYREYIQNAADSIDEGRAIGLFSKGDESPQISIELNKEARSITITDNGIGVLNAEFVKLLSAIGGSKKRGAAFRGFRGVGRLSGLGYCQEVVFRSRGVGDSSVYEIHWDGRRLREVLRDTHFRGGLVNAIKTIAKTTTTAAEEFPEHFFQVELRKLARVKNDVLLNEEAVREYVSQIGPVGFHPDFSFGAEIQTYLAEFGATAPFEIELNDGRGTIYRPFRDEIQVTDKQTDSLHSLEYFKVPGLHEGTAAVGWLLHHSYFGALPRRSGIGGLRVRMGNLQIGGGDFFAGHFVEPRFNQWCVGEIHVVTDKLTPNGRRDDFEYSAHYENLIGHVAPRFIELTRTCRERSALRQQLKAANQYVQQARRSIAVLRSRDASLLVRKVSEWQCLDALVGLAKTGKARALGELERSHIDSEHARLCKDLQDSASRYSARDPFRVLSPGKRKDVEPIVRLIFERVRNQKKAEDLARRVLNAFR